ncbi:hypothetical protein [Halomarina rubra]|uniref:Lipoprotein n=1 Tax=Halomarina rubra TaxID=2071873 RepID=A0ABD6AUA9_9EURY|nr:hypothetical protein [Halomarina rubra]
MNRRAFLRSATPLALVGLAGCSGLAASPNGADSSFVDDWDCAFTEGGDMCRRLEQTEVDHFVYLVRENTIRIEGCYSYGPSDCDDPAVLGVGYDADADELVARFGAKDGKNAVEEYFHPGCNGASAIVGYSMTVRTTGLPETVRVVEAGSGEERSATYRP